MIYGKKFRYSELKLENRYKVINDKTETFIFDNKHKFDTFTSLINFKIKVAPH